MRVSKMMLLFITFVYTVSGMQESKGLSLCDGTSHDFIKPGNTFEILRIGFEEEEAKSVKTNEIDNE